VPDTEKVTTKNIKRLDQIGGGKPGPGRKPGFSANFASSHGKFISSRTWSAATSMVPLATWPIELTRKMRRSPDQISSWTERILLNCVRAPENPAFREQVLLLCQADAEWRR
jgi:hypothetical protein